MADRSARRARRPRGRALAALLALTVTGPVLAACDPTPPPPPPLRVAVLGDSITNDAADELLGRAPGRDVDLTVRSFPGWSLCLLHAEISALADRKPDVFVLQSAGNASFLTTCAQIDGRTPTGEPYLNVHRRDLAIAVALVKQRSPTTEVVVAGMPPLIPDDRVVEFGRVPEGAGTQWAATHLNEIYRSSAAALGYTYVDAGRALADRDGRWTRTLPCDDFEPCVGQLVDPSVGPGVNIVRSPDMLHLCPVQLHLKEETCPVYATGSWRYALAVIGKVVVVGRRERFAPDPPRPTKPGAPSPGRTSTTTSTSSTSTSTSTTTSETTTPTAPGTTSTLPDPPPTTEPEPDPTPPPA